MCAQQACISECRTHRACRSRGVVSGVRGSSRVSKELFQENASEHSANAYLLLTHDDSPRMRGCTYKSGGGLNRCVLFNMLRNNLVTIRVARFTLTRCGFAAHMKAIIDVVRVVHQSGVGINALSTVFFWRGIIQTALLLIHKDSPRMRGCTYKSGCGSASYNSRVAGI